MSEENVKKELRKPWISFGSMKRRKRRSRRSQNRIRIRALTGTSRASSASMRATKGAFNERRDSSIERATGDKSRARSPRISQGRNLSPTWWCSIRRRHDHATFEKPHQYATGCKTCVRQRCAGHQKRRAYRSETGSALWGPGKAEIN